MLLDAESCDYMFQVKASEGFIISVQHHLDQLLMQINELDISPGSVSQIATCLIWGLAPIVVTRSENYCGANELKIKNNCYLGNLLYAKIRFEMENIMVNKNADGSERTFEAGIEVSAPKRHRSDKKQQGTFHKLVKEGQHSGLHFQKRVHSQPLGLFGALGAGNNFNHLLGKCIGV